MRNIKNLPLALGIHTTYKGYHYLVASLEIALADENTLLFFTKSIFPQVAHRYHTSPLCVERDIRTVIKVCWNSSCRQRLIDIAPYQLVKQPTVGEFLDILYWNLTSAPQQTNL